MTQAKALKSFSKSQGERSTPFFGVSNLAFAHEFQSSGEKAINFDSLVPPSGWTNPSSSTILEANLSVYAKQIVVINSQGVAIQPTEYTVSNSKILFKNFESIEGEIFTVQVMGIVKVGNLLVDMRTIHIAKVLPNGFDEVPLGRAVNTQKEQIIVFRQGQAMTADSTVQGNYEYLDVDGNGFSSVIKFHEEANGTVEGPSIYDNTATTGEAILIVSNGGIADNPTISTFQELDSMNARLDKVIEVLVEAVAEEGDGIDESFFGGLATPVDLRQFSQRVYALEKNKQDKIQIAYLKDVKASGVDGGSFTSGDWRTRDLNTVEGDGSFVSLSANQFTLGPGKYVIEASAPAYLVNRHKIKIRNITDSTDTLIGSSEYIVQADAAVTRSEVLGSISVSSTKTFELQHRALGTRAADGFGLASSFGVPEVYTQVKITRLGDV